MHHKHIRFISSIFFPLFEEILLAFLKQLFWDYLVFKSSDYLYECLRVPAPDKIFYIPRHGAVATHRSWLVVLRPIQLAIIAVFKVVRKRNISVCFSYIMLRMRKIKIVFRLSTFHYALSRTSCQDENALEANKSIAV